MVVASAACLPASAALGQSPKPTDRPTSKSQATKPFALPSGAAGEDPRIDTVARCLFATQVHRFVADPAMVQPFTETTLSWQVTAPAGCPIGLSIAGHRVGRTGTLEVTPVHARSRFGLMATILDARSTLATVPVSIDLSACREQPIPQLFVAPRIETAIDEFDAEDTDFKQIEPPRIEIQADELSIRMVVKADVSLFRDATVTLDMGLRFTVRDGVIQPRYTLFRPRADTALPDDFVESKFYDRSDDILAKFKRGFNEGIAEIVSQDERLFDLTTEPSALQATICPFEAAPRPAPNPSSCQDACSDDRDLCFKEPDTGPAVCVALFRACLEACD